MAARKIMRELIDRRNLGIAFIAGYAPMFVYHRRKMARHNAEVLKSVKELNEIVDKRLADDRRLVDGLSKMAEDIHEITELVKNHSPAPPMNNNSSSPELSKNSSSHSPAPSETNSSDNSPSPNLLKDSSTEPTNNKNNNSSPSPAPSKTSSNDSFHSPNLPPKDSSSHTAEPLKNYNTSSSFSMLYDNIVYKWIFR